EIRVIRHALADRRTVHQLVLHFGLPETRNQIQPLQQRKHALQIETLYLLIALLSTEPALQEILAFLMIDAQCQQHRSMLRIVSPRQPGRERQQLAVLTVRLGRARRERNQTTSEVQQES